MLRKATKSAKSDKHPPPTRRSSRLMLRRHRAETSSEIKVVQDQCQLEHNLIIGCKARRSKRRTVFLPEEILITILLCLPAQIIYNKMRYVSRAWNAIIRSPALFNARLMNSTSGIVIQNICSLNYLYFIEVRNGVLETDVLEVKPLRRILNTCRGLVVFEYLGQSHTSYGVANPITGEWFRSPTLPGEHSGTCVLGYAAASKVYKLVSLGPRCYNCRVITIGIDGAWRHLDILDSTLLHVYAVSIGNYIYWSATDRAGHCIRLFDVETETLQIIPVPLGYGHKKLHYLEMDGSFSFVDCDNPFLWDVWLLTEPKDGANGWTNLFRIDLKGKMNSLARVCHWPFLDAFSYPKGWLKIKDELLLVVYVTSYNKCVFVNVSTHEVIELSSLNSIFKTFGLLRSRFYPHVNSFTPIKQV